jgi:hypothetical protein
MTAGVGHGNAYATKDRRIRPVLESVHRALHASAAAVQHVGVDHRRLDAPVAQQLLYGPDVVAGNQQVGREGMAKSVAGRGLDDARFPHCRMEGPLDPSLVKVMTAPFPGARVLREAWRRKYVLPAPFARGAGVLLLQSVGKMDLPSPSPQIRLMESLDLLEMRRELRLREAGSMVTRSLALYGPRWESPHAIPVAPARLRSVGMHRCSGAHTAGLIPGAPAGLETISVESGGSSLLQPNWESDSPCLGQTPAAPKEAGGNGPAPVPPAGSIDCQRARAVPRENLRTAVSTPGSTAESFDPWNTPALSPPEERLLGRPLDRLR